MSKETRSDTTFGSIEGAAEYLSLLLESVNEARGDLEAETALSSAPGMERRQQAIQLATYKLSQLKQHLTTSHRLLNDLRTIRRLLFAERQSAPFESATGSARTVRDDSRRPADQLGGAPERRRPALSARPRGTPPQFRG